MSKLTGRIVFEPTGENRPPAFRDWFLTEEIDPKPSYAAANWHVEHRHILRVVENTLQEVREPRKLTFGEACKLAVERCPYPVAYWDHPNGRRRLYCGAGGLLVLVNFEPGTCPPLSCDILAEWTEIVDEPEAAKPEPDYLIFEKVPGDCVSGEPCMTNDGCVHRQLLIPSPKGWVRLRIVRDFNEVAK